MARQIDLDQLMKYPLRRGSEHCDEKSADPRFLNGVESILEWAQTLPTITQPNELLTLEQLRQMDGDPVYIPEIECWALVKREQFTLLLTFSDGRQCPASEWYEQVGPVYSRPPEGEEGDANRG